MDTLERQFISLLRPMTNRGYYNDYPSQGIFKLEELAVRWPGPNVSPEDLSSHLNALRAAHEAVVGKG